MRIYAPMFTDVSDFILLLYTVQTYVGKKTVSD